ncbi:MAG: HIT family protein [Gammaproteobacteria bacterium]|nr:HIT family protein [Gammaproteobacteria bacterium]
MNHDNDCIFCKIVKGELPCVKVFEDSLTLAFMDISPVAPGHVLIIPKGHYPDMLSVPTGQLKAVSRSVQAVAKACGEAFAPDGINVMQANGAAAGQTVFHLHVHVIPRNRGDGLRLHIESGPSAEAAHLEAIAARLRTVFES